MSDDLIFSWVDRRALAAFLYYDPLPVGAIAVALLLGTSALLVVPVDGPLLILAFCGTGLVYLADRGLGLSPEDHINRPERINWLRRHRCWLWTEAVVYVVGIGAVISLLQWKTLIIATLLGVVGSLHSGLLLGGWRRVKVGGVLKPVLIGGAWAVGAVVLPVVEVGDQITLSALGLTGYRFCLIVPNLLLADWIDREGDEAVGSGSWVTGWSGRAVRVMASVFIGVALIAAAVLVWSGIMSMLLLVDAIGGLLLLAGVWNLRPANSAGHGFILDAMVAWPVVPWIISVLW